MRLLTAGSLVRVQLGEPKRKPLIRVVFSFCLQIESNQQLVFRQTDMRLLSGSPCPRTVDDEEVWGAGRNTEQWTPLQGVQCDHISDRYSIYLDYRDCCNIFLYVEVHETR